jgi:hypothetical protein
VAGDKVSRRSICRCLSIFSCVCRACRWLLFEKEDYNLYNLYPVPMNKTISFLLCAILLSSCGSASLRDAPAKRSVSGGDFLVASFFDAPDSQPEIKTLEVYFSNEEKASLKKESKKEIENFAAEVLSYEDYEIFYEIFFSPESEKLYEKRKETVRKYLIKNGIDKDKIFIKESDAGDIQKDCILIEAQTW